MTEPCEVAVCSRRAPSYSYKDDVISFDALWESALKCCQNVMWKPSVKAFMNNLAFEILRMSTSLANGTWKNCRPHEIIIQYPKRRNGLSIRFPDRVYQRSINDNVLYPEMTRHFIIGNCACQKGKGPDFARMLLKKYLWNFYANYGIEGFVLQIDISSYYATMQHEKVHECFRRYIPWGVEQKQKVKKAETEKTLIQESAKEVKQMTAEKAAVYGFFNDFERELSEAKKDDNMDYAIEAAKKLAQRATAWRDRNK